MALTVYPSDLPAPLLAGYQISRGEGRFITQSASPTPNIRGRYSSVSEPVSMRLMLELPQYGRWQYFFIEEVKRGAEPFLMPEPTIDGSLCLSDGYEPLLFEDGVPILATETWLCLLAGPPTEASNGKAWAISFDVMVMP